MDAFGQRRTAQRAWRVVLAQLLCLGRHTLTNLACTVGRQFLDWSADYRLFSEDQWDMHDLFGVVLQGVLQRLPGAVPLVVGLDDTCLRKSGSKVPGVSWRRDPLSPPFHTNFIRAQRFIQTSAALHTATDPGPASSIPLAFRHAPSVPRPRRWAPAEEWQQYRQQCKQDNLSTRAVGLLRQLRQDLDRTPGGEQRGLVVTVDGSYSNQTVLRGLPPRTVLIGRVRRDLKLFAPVASTAAPGAKPRHGDRLSTPEQCRQDETVFWQTVRAYAAGSFHDFRIKSLSGVLWQKAGWDMPLQVMVIAPLGYRLRKNSKVLYRRAAYLICTDPAMPAEQLLQRMVWRWGIEVNHRDEKQIIGVGQAQLTNPRSVERQPGFAVFSYALLLLAGADTYGMDSPAGQLPLPKWRRSATAVSRPQGLTTEQLIQQLRKELWAHALNLPQEDSEDFVTRTTAMTKSTELPSDLASAVLYGAVA